MTDARDERIELPPKVDLKDPSNVRYWCKRWQVTEGELIAAVEKVGVESTAVAFALGRPAH